MTIVDICSVYSPSEVLRYPAGMRLQREIASRVALGGSPALLLLQHEPVFTVGRRGGAGNLKTSPASSAATGADCERTDRGGDITFHGPGQLVAYPILQLGPRARDVTWYVRKLEQVVIDALQAWGVEGQRIPGRPGVWTDDRSKICALGVRISRGVTTHGFALNVTTDLAWFRHIIPCGLLGTEATSLQKILGPGTPSMTDVKSEIVGRFGANFGYEMVPATTTLLSRAEVAA